MIDGDAVGGHGMRDALALSEGIAYPPARAARTGDRREPRTTTHYLTAKENDMALEDIRDTEHGPVRRYWIDLDR